MCSWLSASAGPAVPFAKIALVANTVDLAALARDLASRSVGAEANVQAHIQTILLFGGLNLGEENLETVELEAQVGGGRRIDIEAGASLLCWEATRPRRRRTSQHDDP